MAFSEKLKEEVRDKSDVRCALCNEPFVEIHHIIPQAEGGPDTFDNAVALCARCHDIYGGNPTKRKQLREKRDSWYKIVEAKKTSRVIHKHHVYEKIKYVYRNKPKDEKAISIYHVVYENEDFNDAAHALIELTQSAQQKFPGKKRVLFLDIDGHKLENGAFDHDMWELQFHFILKNLFNYYSEVHMPLISVQNTYEQLEDNIFENFIIFNEENTPSELKEHEGCILRTTMSEDELREIKENDLV